MRVEVLKAEKKVGGRKILDASDFTIESGRIYAVMGPNGAGKTTLLRILAGIEQSAFSQILYDGSELVPRDKIAYMTQSAYLFDTTVGKNVLLGIEDEGASEEEMNRAVSDSLRKVGMEGFLEAKAKSLSGGEAQRVALARILIMKKDLVLLDEPSSATDIKGAELIEEYIQEVNKNERTTFVFTTHNPSQAQRIADEIIFMNSGKITEKGVPSRILNKPENEETERFLRNWRIANV
ncbi:MAG: ATP-binding cassette domain-containing protein [Eubacteriaceae bacterium]|nr:ATP-binding cassette domain-containing protein [Eubacteriaceae bacterium]